MKNCKHCNSLTPGQVPHDTQRITPLSERVLSLKPCPVCNGTRQLESKPREPETEKPPQRESSAARMMRRRFRHRKSHIKALESYGRKSAAVVNAVAA